MHVDPLQDDTTRWFRDLPLEHPVVRALFDLALERARNRPPPTPRKGR